MEEKEQLLDDRSPMDSGEPAKGEERARPKPKKRDASFADEMDDDPNMGFNPRWRSKHPELVPFFDDGPCSWADDGGETAAGAKNACEKRAR